MAHRNLLDPIHPGEILFQEFMKPMDNRGEGAGMME